MTTIHAGGCHCGAVRYEVTGEPIHVTLCYCTDCRRSAGAPAVAWAGVLEAQFAVVKGAPKTINSSGDAMRSFCGTCGSGLFYHNATVLPGLVDIQSATLDDPDAWPVQAHIQVAERIGWAATMHDLPVFDRFPPAA